MAANLILGIPARYVVTFAITATVAFVAYQVKATVVSVEEIFTDEDSSLSGIAGSGTIVAVVVAILYFVFGKGAK